MSATQIVMTGRPEGAGSGGEASFGEPPVLGEGLLRRAERGFLWLERAVDRAVPPALNPVAQTGAVSVVTFLVACVTGVLVLFWYSPSVTYAWSSVRGMEGSPWLAGMLRSLHRYSSDACMLFVLLHASRLFVARRFGGARKLAWVTGIILLVCLWGTGWLGYWLVWDARGQAVAVGTAKMMDVLPVFTDPLSRAFLTDAGVSSLLFFVVFFCHMLLPLGMGIPLWLHINRLSRARFLTRLPLGLWITASLVALSLLLPVTAADAAQMTRAPGQMTLDAWYLLPLWVTDRLGPGALWALFLTTTLLLGALPWLLARKRPVTAKVDVSGCNACTLCVQDCPYDAIRMVPRTDGRNFELQAQIDFDKCVGCGICAGACNPGAIGLEPLPVRSARRSVEDWVAQDAARGEDVRVLYACSLSAGGALDVGEEGRSAALPGYRVLKVPCAGWVHALTPERALKKGAGGVLISACGPGECTYREGAGFMQARIDAQRAPQLRHDQVDVSRVKLVRADASNLRALVKAAEAFRKVGAQGVSGAPGRLPAVVGGAAVAMTSLALIWAPSHVPHGGTVQAPELVVSFKHPGRNDQRCRTVSPEELAKLPPHMRRPEECDRGRADVWLRVEVDGEVVHERAYPPTGLSKDGSSVAVARIPVKDGPRQVSVRLGDSGEAGEWTYAASRTVDAQPGRRAVVVFDRLSGFRWEGG